MGAVHPLGHGLRRRRPTAQDRRRRRAHLHDRDHQDQGRQDPASRCDVKSLEGCNEREAKYVEGKKGLTKEQLVTELERLNELGGKKMAPAQEQWRAGRVKLLTKLKLEL